METKRNVALFVRPTGSCNNGLLLQWTARNKNYWRSDWKSVGIKKCYAAYSKGTTALLAAILAASESLGVREELYQQWELDDPGFFEQVNRRITRVTAKAWRFEGEMKEIAETFQVTGLPDEFHQAAAEVYGRMSIFKDSAEIPSLQNVLRVLLAG
jgi:hypothetical protein